MVSKLMRRSGIGLGGIVERLNWQPDVMVQVGVGLNHQEIDVFKEEWPGLEIVAFEPHPKVYKSIHKGFPGTLYQLALSDKDGSKSLYFRKRHKDGASFHKHKPKEGNECESVKVSVSSLDHCFPSGPPNNKRVLLWLDCEGSELNVLKGGENFVKKVDVINVELTAKPRMETWCRTKDVHNWLISHGFIRQWLHTLRNCIGQYDAVYVKSSLFDPQYCCDPWST